MRARRRLLLPILGVLLPLRSALAAPDIAGRWLTEDKGGVIEIAPCGASLCGRIIGMTDPYTTDGQIERDYKGQPKCGLPILSDAAPSSSGKWDAHITNPDDGKIYDSQLFVDDQNRLHLRGYVLIPLLGETQIWTRYTRTIGPGCQMN